MSHPLHPECCTLNGVMSHLLHPECCTLNGVMSHPLHPQCCTLNGVMSHPLHPQCCTLSATSAGDLAGEGSETGEERRSSVRLHHPLLPETLRDHPRHVPAPSPDSS
ncbi:hypothetical protein T484DRAFT_3356988 [Baffinella frigidus]|nr:hypothetical protein T484DRAFT_3356988 [Cryptophyta sp. CCMP2293]